MILDGTTFQTPRGPVPIAPVVSQEVFISAAGAIHTWEQHDIGQTDIQFSLLLSASEATQLQDKYYNVARGSKNAVTLQLDASDPVRSVHFWLGKGGLQLRKIRNDLYTVSLRFKHVGTPAVWA